MKTRIKPSVLRLFAFAIVFVCMAALAPSASAQTKQREKDRVKPSGPVKPTATPVPGTGYNAYRLVQIRNIFDPNRKPPPPENPQRNTQAETPKPGRTGLVVLTGTMVTDTKRRAFFTGSSSEYNKVVSVDDKLGELTVVGISASHVDLKRGDQALVLPVGKQLSLGAKSDVSAAPAPVVSASAPLPNTTTVAPGQSSAGGSADSAQVGTPAEKADVIRRMMERRKLETK